MANIADTAGIFVGATLDLFNTMEALVLRDGDVAGAQAELQVAMKKIASASVVPSGSGSTYKHRSVKRRKKN